MKAFVMAAGAGTRLRPLTYAIPKPMVPILNKPVISYALETLKKHGVSEVALNLHHYPEMIKEYYSAGEDLGLKINYSYEKKLMGTAGGVKKMEKFLDSTFVIMSGDGLTDIDLSKAIDFHRNKKALGTMVLKAIESKFDYGVTITNKSGLIKKFIEKPRWADVFTNTVNTGIYIFEPEIFKYIPKDKFFDFGLQLWPYLLKEKKKIYGYLMKEYWTDVGNLTEYKRAIHDVLDGKLKIKFPGRQIKPGIWVGKSTKIDKGAVLKAPCVIGSGCHIGKNAVIDSYTSVGDNSMIGSGAVLKNSVLWGNVKVSKNVNLDNCIIGYKAEISENISVFEGTVLNIE